ncbi:hypothetical protein ACHAWF_017219 [Thalassiosira exigua]
MTKLHVLPPCKSDRSRHRRNSGRGTGTPTAQELEASGVGGPEPLRPATAPPGRRAFRADGRGPPASAVGVRPSFRLSRQLPRVHRRGEAPQARGQDRNRQRLRQDPDAGVPRDEPVPHLPVPPAGGRRRGHLGELRHHAVHLRELRRGGGPVPLRAQRAREDRHGDGLAVSVFGGCAFVFGRLHRLSDFRGGPDASEIFLLSQTGMYTCIPDIAYVVFGMPCSDEGAKKSFAKLLEEHFPVLMDVYLKDTPFVYSDKPTIADLSIAPVMTFLKCRGKFWAKVPQKVKDYHARVLAAFPDTKENFDMLDGMCSSYLGDGADLEP